MTIKEMKELAVIAASKQIPADYAKHDMGAVNAALADGFRDMAGSINQFMKNRYDIYEIIVTGVDEVVPNKVISALGIFAEVRQVGQGQKALFKKKLGRNRAKKFLTQVGLAGVYETFRLDNSTYEVPAHAVGGAATIDFERMLDGAEDLAELVDIIAEAMEESVFIEVQKALRAAVNQTGVPAKNRVIQTTGDFDGDAMMGLCTTVKAYGNGAVIFAPPEFVAAMGADAIVPVGASYQGVYSPQDIEAIHNTGYINLFRGNPIVQIPQSFTDENNDTTVIDPQLAYVLPTGNTKVVKVVMEGNTQIYDAINRDQSMEINVYRKLGVAIETYHNWGIYQNQTIQQTLDADYQ